MDPTAQSTQPPVDQPADQASGTTPPSSDDQAAAARGDIPMSTDNSIAAASIADSAALSNLEAVNTAQMINNDITQKEVSAGGAPQKLTDHGKSADQIRSLGEKIEKAPIPEEFKQELLDRISRLAMIRSSAGFLSSTYIMEYESTSRFVNWVIEMPWGNKSEDVLDLAKAKEQMDKNHYGLGPLKQRVLEYIASLMLNIKNYGNDAHLIKAPILCIVGLAGTGKTTFAKSLADALGRKFERIPFGGMADSRVLRGQSRYFPDAEPGQIIKRLVHGGTSNPVILLDELDRVTDTARADIMGVLIEILDPEQNAKFTDHYIDYPFNLQNVLFVATANNVSSVATAVLDRLEIIQMPSYNDEEKTVIGRDFVLPKTMQMTGLLPDQLSIDPGVWEGLVRPLGYDPGIRGLDRLITGMCRKAATVIISGQADKVKITTENVKQFLPEW
ncbi:MAG TPA: AAA family ATPase [Xanthomonadales bacterium]|nr:AAA family ATPase [Xanthomonadales bacterium]